MRIAVFSKSDRSGGGAGRVAETLCELLIQAGHDVTFFLQSYAEKKPHFRPLADDAWSKLKACVNSWTKTVGFPELIPFEYFTFLLRTNFRPSDNYDIAHFHDLSSAISPLTVRYVARRLPTVWTFHDCSPFTGGCLDPAGCERFTHRCGACPQLGRWPIDTSVDFTGVSQNIKRRTALECKFTPVVPSKWMANLASDSRMFGQQPTIIPNGVDTSVFIPRDKKTVRKYLGLPIDRPIILLSSQYLFNKRKGIALALDVIRRLNDLKPHVILVGKAHRKDLSHFADLSHHHVGLLEDDRVKALWFSAADIFLYCSVSDNLPLVVLETMAAGTPTVGFDTGGIPEMVENGKSGLLVKAQNIEELVAGLKQALTSRSYEDWGIESRRIVMSRFSLESFLSKHIKLYENLCGQRAA